MIKFILLILSIGNFSHSELIKLSSIGPSIQSRFVFRTISDAGVNKESCLTNIDTSCNQNTRFNILSSGTTIYSIYNSSGTSVSKQFKKGTEICSSINEIMYVNAIPTDGAGQWNISYIGYIK